MSSVKNLIYLQIYEKFAFHVVLSWYNVCVVPVGVGGWSKFHLEPPSELQWILVSQAEINFAAIVGILAAPR